MEDALVLKKKIAWCKSYARLNPCFNGRCTRTFFLFNHYTIIFHLLLLVLLEDAVLPHQSDREIYLCLDS